MKLKELLLKKRSNILEMWIDSILESYPSDTKLFFQKRNNQFANPVGHTIAKEIENLYDLLLDDQDVDRERLSPILDRLIRIRSIQDFSPSQAVVFIHALKKIVKERFMGEIRENNLFEDLLKFYEQIDNAMLIAFDIYSGCRETLYEIKAEQAKKQVSGLLRKVGLVCELPEWSPDQEEGDIVNDYVNT